MLHYLAFLGSCPTHCLPHACIRTRFPSFLYNRLFRRGLGPGAFSVRQRPATRLQWRRACAVPLHSRLLYPLPIALQLPAPDPASPCQCSHSSFTTTAACSLMALKLKSLSQRWCSLALMSNTCRDSGTGCIADSTQAERGRNRKRSAGLLTWHTEGTDATDTHNECKQLIPE